MIELVPLIGSIVSSTVSVCLAVHRWWQNKRDRRVQHEAYEQSRPTSDAAKELEKLMGVQSNFWSRNPEMWAALGNDAAGIVASSYSRSDSYVKDLAMYLGNAPDNADWSSASTGLMSVSSQLKGMFALHLGKMIVKMALRTRNVFTKMFISKQVKESMAQENARLLLQAQHDLNSLAGQFEAGREGSIRQLEWYEQEQVREQQRSLAPQQRPSHPTQPQQLHSSQTPPSYSASQMQQYTHQTHSMQQTTQKPGIVYVMTEEVSENDRNDCVIA